jgi:hypothetical protein
MSGVKNVLTSCLAESGNTGVGDCFVDIGMPRVIFFVPDNAVYSTADVATFVAALKAAILNDTPRNRVFPVQNIVNVDDQTEKTVIQTFNTGAKAKVRPGFYDVTAQWVTGGFCVLYNLLKANGRNKRFLIGTDTGLIIGTDAGTALNPEQMKGIKPALIDAEPFGFSDGSKKSEYRVHLNWEPTQINQGIAFVDVNSLGGLSDIEQLEGLQNVTLTAAAAATGTTVTIKATTACGAADLYDDFADNLASVDAWSIIREDTGAAVVPTGVAKNAGLKAWVLTFVTPGLSKALDVRLAGPTELAADPIDVVGYESNMLVQTTPSA